jgi:hypothetical protein
VSQHRADLEHNPWILLGAFAGIAVLLFALLRFTGSSGAQQAHDTTPGGTPGPAVVATDGPSPSPSATVASPTTSRPGKPLLPDAAASRLRARVGLVQLPVTTNGPLGAVAVPAGRPVAGDVTISTANIPNTHANSAWYGSIHALIAPQPDFVTLNEVYKHSTAGIEASAPGYTCYRVETEDSSPGGRGQSMNNVVLWRTDRWEQLDGGRVRVVDNDRGILRGKAFLWDRFAIWSILRRKSDGAVVSVISVHMPTNPYRTATVNGFPVGARIAKYAGGMDAVVGMVHQLEHYGPVLVGGDMNSHPGEGGWTAAAKMGGAGYTYAKDSGVMYDFFRGPASLAGLHQIHIVSDHPAIITTIAMNGAGPTS